MSPTTETLILGFVFGIISVVLFWAVFQCGFELGKEHCIAHPSECVVKQSQEGNQ
jgi:hypothetical protein